MILKTLLLNNRLPLHPIDRSLADSVGSPTYSIQCFTQRFVYASYFAPSSVSSNASFSVIIQRKLEKNWKRRVQTCNESEDFDVRSPDCGAGSHVVVTFLTNRMDGLKIQ